MSCYRIKIKFFFSNAVFLNENSTETSTSYENFLTTFGDSSSNQNGMKNIDNWNDLPNAS